ncbi:DUF1097 domain-containing protein [Photobacterium sp. 1_MG-2023]|uniref:DUF1097 domain-containing protein n=1 Tax=Photobacterium sp. 1_MG-2023 TaxID=3062646 RepID=UPI0026E30565|nr:DUF1097 domain-containing protein [Photobacterium sp. 1_MG-2023]MDO6707043.1 DUF1097 domain-containing protein [Photobacterium sp. 1_MG-2023]
MSVLIAIAITTGILSGLWGWIAVSLGLLSWAGFLGCTTYFASPQDGLKGVGLSLATNLSGVAWAMMIIHGSEWIGIEVFGYVMTALVSFLMCVQAKRQWLSFIPGTFIGCCATFAANGHWQLVIPSLILGVCFGYAMKTSGLWLQAKSQKTAAPVVHSAAAVSGKSSS